MDLILFALGDAELDVFGEFDPVLHQHGSRIVQKSLLEPVIRPRLSDHFRPLLLFALKSFFDFHGNPSFEMAQTMRLSFNPG